MPDEKLNDIKEIADTVAGESKALNPWVDAPPMCWCGSEPMHPSGPTCHESSGGAAVGIHSVPVRDDMAAVRELVPALTKSVNRLCAILEAIATHGGTLTLNKMDDAAPRTPMPLQPGDRASYNGRRGVLRSIGVAGTGILYDDGRYALLTNAMAAKLVRE